MAQQRPQVQDVAAVRDKRVQRLVVDTNALIKRVRLDELAQNLYTVPSVLVRPAHPAWQCTLEERSLDHARARSSR